tara:strand:- start:114 stop:569 length:456 start_codon:yes stop_codon:yes gene_type:complete
MKLLKNNIIIMNRLIILLLSFVVISIMSCEKEIQCLNCNSHELDTFEGDLNNFYDTLIICENSQLWEEIIWYDECNGCVFPDNSGGTGSLIDLDEYIVGLRTIENHDVDNDGILNEYDDDIDGDGILNYLDITQYGDKNNNILELVICTHN